METLAADMKEEITSIPKPVKVYIVEIFGENMTTLRKVKLSKVLLCDLYVYLLP